MRRSLSQISASVAAAALSFGLLAATPGLAEAGAPPDKTTYLGLEGEGDPVASLSDAIRWDLNQRGMDDGNTMTLPELKLTMGCGDEDLTCFAQGGQTLGSTELVFGEAHKNGNDYIIRLKRLDVGTGELSNSLERTVSFVELGEAQLGKTAASLIDELYEIGPSPEELPPDETDGGDGDGGGGGGGEGQPGVEDQPDKPPKKDGALVWGPYSPRPAWKYAGVGISGALLVGGVVMGVIGTTRISANGPLRAELLAEAEASLDDNKAGNDIDPNSSQDLCELARTPPDASKPNEVTNARVTEVCIKFDQMGTLATVGWITTGVFAVSTIAFTTLLFVHRSDKTAKLMRKHNVAFGGAPRLEGGFSLGGSFSF